MTPEQTIVAATRREFARRPVLLCGSRALGEEAPDSDFDVVVVLPSLRIPLALRRMRAMSRGLAVELGAPVTVNPLPSRRLQRLENLFVWKLRREARVLSAPAGFTLDRAVEAQLTPIAAFSYLLTGVFYLLEGLDPRSLALARLTPEHERQTAKALLHVAQVRLLRKGRYESRLADAMGALDERDLIDAVGRSAEPEGWFRARDLLLAELEAPRRLGGSVVTNARYAFLAALRGRGRFRAAIARRRIDEMLGDAAVQLLTAVGRTGAVDEAALARAHAALPRALRPGSERSWTSLRDLLVREWPDAHPLSAL